MRTALWLMVASMTASCTTMTYTSQRPAAVVSDCIASGWRKAPSSGLEVPVSRIKTGDDYYVDVVLARDFPTDLPIPSIWVKVRPDSPGDAAGSSTEYRRYFQISHQKIDRIVEECQ